jgi:formylglycine-generating enzyme required for sulfatase activity
MIVAVAAALLLAMASAASADRFGTDGNQFTIDFVTISGNASIANGMNISQFPPGQLSYKAFTDPGSTYRMGVYEITNSQWDKFKASLGVPVTGRPSNAYANSAYFTGASIPANEVSWYEAAQFVNWLNTTTGHQVAYNFIGTPGQSDYTLTRWGADKADGTNLYRNKDAFYYLPTEDEWVKAAYWNGTTLQTYSTPADTLPVEDVEANYEYESGAQPWNVGSGIKEVYGTFDMMGNVWEWMESPHSDTNYGIDSIRVVRGGACRFTSSGGISVASDFRYDQYPANEYDDLGFRVASEVPEPATLSLLALGGLAMLRRHMRGAK